MAFEMRTGLAWINYSRSRLEPSGARRACRLKGTEPLPKSFQMTRDDRFGYGRKSKTVALLLFFGVGGLYVVTMFGILVLHGAWSMLLSLVCGLVVAIFFVVGHDACHQSFTDSQSLNHLLGRLAFLPSLHPYSLWDIGHNRVHHRFNNIRGKDYVWEP